MSNSLYWIRWQTGNQCNSDRTGVIWWQRLVRETSLAAAFCSLWRRWICFSGKQESKQLHESMRDVMYACTSLSVDGLSRKRLILPSLYMHAQPLRRMLLMWEFIVKCSSKTTPRLRASEHVWTSESAMVTELRGVLFWKREVRWSTSVFESLNCNLLATAQDFISFTHCSILWIAESLSAGLKRR
jgi:hypothetical protein